MQTRLLSVVRRTAMDVRDTDPFEYLVHVAREFEPNDHVYYVACRGRMSKVYFVPALEDPTCVACIGANLRPEWP